MVYVYKKFLFRVYFCIHVHYITNRYKNMIKVDWIKEIKKKPVYVQHINVIYGVISKQLIGYSTI